MRYAETIDLLGYVEPDDGTGIDVIDIKCTSEYHPVLLVTQLGAYAEALNSRRLQIFSALHGNRKRDGGGNTTIGGIKMEGNNAIRLADLSIERQL